MDESSDQQIAAEAGRRAGAMQLAPRQPQFCCRPIEQPGYLMVGLGEIRTARSAGPIGPIAALTGNGRQLARVLASRRVVGWQRHALAGSAMRYTRPRSSLAEARVSPSFFFKVREKTPRTV